MPISGANDRVGHDGGFSVRSHASAHRLLSPRDRLERQCCAERIINNSAENRVFISEEEFMNAMTWDYPDELTPATMAEYEAAMTVEASTCGLSVHDVELLTALRAIEAGRPFLVKDQWLVATGQHADGTIAAMSVDRKDGKVQIHRWKLTVAFIYALLCEDGITFPGLPMSLCAPIPVS